MVRLITMIKTLCSFLTVATLYIASDWIYDASLCYLPSPIDWCLYAGRYGAVIIYYVLKIKKKLNENSS